MIAQLRVAFVAGGARALHVAGLHTVLVVWSSALCVIFMILVSLENVKKSVLGGCTITRPIL